MQVPSESPAREWDNKVNANAEVGVRKVKKKWKVKSQS